MRTRNIYTDIDAPSGVTFISIYRYADDVSSGIISEYNCEMLRELLLPLRKTRPILFSRYARYQQLPCSRPDECSPTGWTVCTSAALVLQKRQRRRRNRRVWTRQWVLNRGELGAFHQLMEEIRLLDTSSYKNFVRMDAVTFEDLLSAIAPRITYQDTVMRQAISPAKDLLLLYVSWLQVCFMCIYMLL